MALNLEGFRIEIARELYEDSIGAESGETWFAQSPEIREGFIRFASAALSKIWEKDPRDVVEFFVGYRLEIEEGCGGTLETSRRRGAQHTQKCGRPHLCNACIVKVLTHEKK